MKKILFISFVSLLSVSMSVSAKPVTASPEVKAEVQTQTNRTLNGIVFDKQTNESLAGAVITVNGQKVYTDLDGNFSVQNICDDKCEIKVSLISYQEQTIEIDAKNSKSVKIQLSQR